MKYLKVVLAVGLVMFLASTLVFADMSGDIRKDLKNSGLDQEQINSVMSDVQKAGATQATKDAVSGAISQGKAQGMTGQALTDEIRQAVMSMSGDTGAMQEKGSMGGGGY